MGFDIEFFEDEDDGLPMKHRIAKTVLTGIGALLMREMISVYYNYILTTHREAKEEEKE